MKIDLSEPSPRCFSRAPIVEAVIDLRAKPTVNWEPDSLKAQLKELLPDYPHVQTKRTYQSEFKAAEGKPPEQKLIDLGWSGLMLKSQDRLQVLQFQKEGFAFSRLPPYQDWASFSTEALRLWDVYVKTMKPEAIQRIGVRFIDRMLFPADGFKLKNYIVESQQPLESVGLISCGFLYRDTLAVPETGYNVTLIRTIQPPEGTPPTLPVILDVDVFTTSPSELDGALVRHKLQEIRWLKNKIFFSSITETTKGMYQ